MEQRLKSKIVDFVTDLKKIFGIADSV